MASPATASATSSPCSPTAGTEQAVDIGPHLDAKIAAARCYATQLGFQLGGTEHVAARLRELAAAEARRVGGGTPSEVLTGAASCTALAARHR
ncbi:MAG: hypothetical protein DLM62_16725 [Pseudonocardiales bacterium]|nr:MAG: hypothetical protein DLM62_16725 [Pseudonocardiales bacterium]